MTKSITNALIGILIKQGKLDLYIPALVSEWQGPDDPRSTITLDQMLRMESGLRFVEEYEENIDSDCNTMLFDSFDTGKFAAAMPLDGKPGSKWSYSSGTANILARIIREVSGKSQAEQFDFPRKALFEKIGMMSAIMEPDPSGTFVGSSFMYATARDWARFGLLYLQDGIWEGQRILPEGWVQFTRRPTQVAPSYGALFWLNACDNNGRRVFSEYLPEDLVMARGYGGQIIAIIPSRKLVVVRLGQSDDDDWGCEQFMVDLLEAVPQN